MSSYDSEAALEDLFHYNPDWTGDSTINQNISSSVLDSIQIDPGVIDSVIKHINDGLPSNTQITDWEDNFKYTTDQNGQVVYTEQYSHFLGGLSDIYAKSIGEEYLQNEDIISSILANDENLSNLIGQKNAISSQINSLNFKNKSVSFDFSDSVFDKIIGLQITDENAPALKEQGYSIGIRGDHNNIEDGNPTFVFLKEGKPFSIEHAYTQGEDGTYSTADLYSTGGGGYRINKNKAMGMNQTIQKPGLGSIDYLPGEFNPEYGNQYTYDMMHIHHYKQDGEYLNNSFTARFGTESNWFDVGNMIMEVKKDLGHFDNMDFTPPPSVINENYNEFGDFTGEGLMASGDLVYNGNAPMGQQWTNANTGESFHAAWAAEESFGLGTDDTLSSQSVPTNYELPTFLEFADYYLSDLKDTSGVHIFSSNAGLLKTSWTIGDIEAAETKLHTFIATKVAENEELTNQLYENLEFDTPGWEGGDIGWFTSSTDALPVVNFQLGITGSEDIYGQPAGYNLFTPGGQGNLFSGDNRNNKHTTSPDGLELDKSNLIRPWTDDWDWHKTSGVDPGYSMPGVGYGSDSPENTSSYGAVSSMRNTNREPGDPLDLFNYQKFFRERVNSGNLNDREKTIYRNYQKIVENSKLMHEYEKGLMVMSWLLNGRGFAGDEENFTYIHEAYGVGSGTEYSTSKDTTHLGNLPSLINQHPNWGTHGSAEGYQGTGYDVVSENPSNARNFSVGKFYGQNNISVTGNRYYNNPYDEGYNFTSPIWYHGLPWSSDVHPDQKQNFGVALALAETYKGEAGYLRGDLNIPLRDQYTKAKPPTDRPPGFEDTYNNPNALAQQGYDYINGSVGKVYFSGLYNYNTEHSDILKELTFNTEVLDDQIRSYLTENYNDYYVGDIVNLPDLLTKDANALRGTMLKQLDSHLETTLDSIGNDLYKTKAFKKVADDLRTQILKGNYNIFIDEAK